MEGMEDGVGGAAYCYCFDLYYLICSVVGLYRQFVSLRCGRSCFFFDDFDWPTAFTVRKQSNREAENRESLFPHHTSVTLHLLLASCKP
jgi:hypothetical protein